MKKLLLFLIITITTYCYSPAQELGVRFGDVSGGNVAVDGVFSLAKFSRIHADVSFGHGVGVDALWDFLYRPLPGEAFNWYIGVGPYIRIDDPFWLGAVFEAGIEYRFKTIPLVIGADWRPALSIIETTEFHWPGFGVNVRYVFGQKAAKAK